MHSNTQTQIRAVQFVPALPAFAVTIFLSAGLMFLVEPMVAKMVLPRLGGSPAVWSTCLVFFQAVLLLGYAYAHALTHLFTRKVQILIHVVVLLPLAAMVLPPDLGGAAPPPEASPTLWLLLRLGVIVGPPVFAISATAPLLQSWFTGVDHEGASDPYFLYAVSNGGSLLALLAYPMLIEPEMSLAWQTTLWSCGFVLLVLGVALCATARRAGPDAYIASSITAERVTLRQRLTWTALAFVPSSLLLGVTTHITSDIVSAPLLWVVPLMLYLLTFILTFARRPPLRHAIMVRALPLVLIPLVTITASELLPSLPLPMQLVLHLGCFFAVGMVCHGELARQRPLSTQLTEFYLFLSVGGVLGGAFNALLAPLIFSGAWEYPLALIATSLIKPAKYGEAKGGPAWDIGLPVALLCFVLLFRIALPAVPSGGKVVLAFGCILPALALLNFSQRPWRFALGVTVMLFAPEPLGTGSSIASNRSFFGVYRVQVVEDGGERAIILKNGTTLHGVRSLVPGEETLPMGYYSREGPFGSFFGAFAPGALRNVAVVGLGTGELACYTQPGQDWTFYEIDPLVERMAREYFQFLAICGGRSRVVIGDARMTIAEAVDAKYDAIVIDAFSSDSIPMHLLTREALALYLRKLTPEGRLLFHISSRTLNLIPIIGALAADAGVPARMRADGPKPGISALRHAPTIAVAVAGRGRDLSRLDRADGWNELPGTPKFLWTDQRSDIVRAIRWGF